MKLVLYSLGLLSLTFFGVSCETRTEVEQIVDAAIAAHGGEHYAESAIDFDFRGTHYFLFKSPIAFEYRREFTDSTGQVVDVLNNAGFTRKVNGVLIDTLAEERIGAFSRSVNSVAYFAFLPYGLNDAAAIKTFLGQTKIKGKDYHQVKVTFKAEGGGEHFEDEFLYSGYFSRNCGSKFMFLFATLLITFLNLLLLSSSFSHLFSSFIYIVSLFLSVQ